MLPYRLKNLLSPLFITCLGLLMINDFLLKPMFHNTLTGKLSDLCGLFIFPIFWSAVFSNYRKWVYVLTGMLFVFWKSEYATGPIEPLDRLFNISRTVDYSDLLALVALPLAWIYTNKPPHLKTVNFSMPYRLGAFCTGIVAIFAFCATSQQRYVQSFEQPQYVLLHSAVTPDSTLYDEFSFYKKADLLVVKVNHWYINKPIRDDDYNRNRSLKDIDQEVRFRIADSTQLIPKGSLSLLTVVTGEGIDTLRFKGSRLDGRFSRTKNGKLIIEGFYKMGIADGDWTFKNDRNVTIKTFVNGEGTSIKHLANNELVSTTLLDTRADAIRTTYVQLSILILLSIGIILLLIRNYRKSHPGQLGLKTIWKVLLCVTMPFFVWLAHMGIKILLMENEQDIFAWIGAMVLIYIITCPLMFAVVFLIKLRKEVDILLYGLLFALLCSACTTYGTIIALSN